MASPFPVLTDLSAVDQQSYLAAETYIMQLLAERFPDRDFGYGRALYWTTVVPVAAADAAVETDAELMGKSLTLEWLKENAATVDPDLAEAILSNYYQTLAKGAPSVGTIAVVVNTQTSYTVNAGTRFTTNGQDYLTTIPIYVQVSAGNVTTPNDRLLTPRADGTFQFLVPVQSADVGVATFAPLGTVFTLASPPPSLVTAVAATDISGGTDTQTIGDIIAQIPGSFATQTVGSALTTAALIAKNFPGTRAASVGMGDPEQTRDTHNLLQIQTGGMVDLFCVTQGALASELRTVTAVLINVAAKTWQITIGRDDADGIYSVVSVVPAGSSKNTMPILGLGRSIAIPASVAPATRPLITTPAEAAFSAYQAFLVTFTDTLQDTNGLSVGAKRSYDIVVTKQPLIRAISDFITANRTHADNVLVRAAVACVVRISVVIRLLDSDTLSIDNITAIRQALVTRVAKIGFGYGILSGGVISGVIAPYLSGRSDIQSSAVTLRGDIVAPNGDAMVVTGTDLIIPTDLARGVSAKNTVFMTDPSRISIQVESVAT